MKKIGVVGVCIGGTSLFYPYFVRQAILRFDKKNSEVFIHQLPLEKVDDAFNQLTKQNFKPLVDLILYSINQLKKFDVDIIVIPNNAAHTVIDIVQTKSPIPVINLVDVINEYCVTHKFKKILTLGTRWLMEQRLFQKRYQRLANKERCEFLNAAQYVSSSQVDGVHLDESSHIKLGKAIAKKVEQIFT